MSTPESDKISKNLASTPEFPQNDDSSEVDTIIEDIGNQARNIFQKNKARLT